jgi:hypothetical protein
MPTMKSFAGKRNGGYIDQQPQWRKITMIGRLIAAKIAKPLFRLYHLLHLNG